MGGEWLLELAVDMELVNGNLEPAVEHPDASIVAASIAVKSPIGIRFMDAPSFVQHGQLP